MPKDLGGGDLLTLADGEASERGIDPRSPAAWLVLALVIQQPSHGYEIDQRYDSRFGSFLPLTTSRVYGALARLSEAGLIERIALKPEGRSRKQHKLRQSYRATRAGVQAYRQWAAERMLDDPQRVEILSRIASVGLLGFDAVVDVVDRYEQGCMQELMVIPTEDARLEAGEYTPEQLWECLIVEQRRRELQARRDWAMYARHVLRYSPAHQDGGYLHRLASTCRRIMAELPSARAITRVLIHASERCGEAQSHNHAMVTCGISSFVEWSGQQPAGEGYLWWELAAGGISCLAIHALLALASDHHSTPAEALELDRAYFPPVCAISALLDSLADYHRDAGTSNHSFIAHYRDGEHAAQRLAAIAKDGATRLRGLRHHRRHTIILTGITSFYLSSPSVQEGFPALPARALAQHVGPIAMPMRLALRARRKLHTRAYSDQ